jgi:curved DNA-binding protein
MEYKDYYKILGVSRDASQDEIKRAYRKLARKYHPDVSKEKNAELRFKELGEANEVLKDKNKRATYDQLGSNWQAGEQFRPPPGWNQGSSSRNDSGVNFSDFFDNMFSGNRQQSHNPFRSKGEDQHTKISISLEDAYHGSTRSLKLESPEVHRTGHRITKTRTLNVKIPKGVTEGKKIRLSGQGAGSMNGGPRGDLYLEIAIKDHHLYRLEGKDISFNLPITPWEAALGGNIKVPTLAGSVDLKLPADSQSGKKLRLKGRGLPGNPAGDYYVILQIMTPKADTNKEKEFYRKMAEEFSFNPRANLV